MAPDSLTTPSILPDSLLAGAFMRAKTRSQFVARHPAPVLLARSCLDLDQTNGLGIATLVDAPPDTPLCDHALAVISVGKRGVNAFEQMVTLGRARNNDIRVEHSMVSKFHAYLREEETGWTVWDTSRNGTRVDGLRVDQNEARPVVSGSLIQLAGAVVLQFLAPGDLFDMLAHRSESDLGVS